jgi:hypothetical protein
MSACLDRSRVNERCDWTESPAALDLADWPQQVHLYKDTELADELAIRYADRQFKERYGHYGRGGLIEDGRFRERCTDSLLVSIAATHRLPLETVKQARARGYRDARWDAGVLLSFASLYGLLAWVVVRKMSRGFLADEQRAALVVSLLTSIPVALLGFQLFSIWGGTLEAFRIGNGHMSTYRAAKSPWPSHSMSLLVGAVTIFLLITVLYYWLESRRHRSARRPASEQKPT